MKDFEIPFVEVLAKNIRRLLEEQDKSQADLARYLGVSKTAVTKWVRGLSDPRIDKVDKMCEFFNCSRADLMYEVQKNGQEDWYYDDEAAAAAQFLYENPEYKVLFDASRKIKKEDIELVKALLDKMKAEDEY